ncbi:MAG: MFS transporter [Streptosporangiaceae bacterium]
MTDVVIPLRRNLRFQTFWTGSISATLGQAVGDVAYPLAIVTMTGSPGKAALFSAVQIAGMLAAGLPVGSLADRHDSQRLALVAHAARTIVACVVAIALAGGWLTLPLLVAAAVVLGAGQSLGGAASILLLRSIVHGEQLTLALTQDEVRINGASLAGPALAGALYGLHHVAPFTFTAAAFFLALAATAFLPAKITRPTPSEEPAEGGMLAGLRELWAQPVLRAVMMLIMGVNTVGAGLELVVIVILRHQAVPPYAIGLALGIGAAGGLAGAPLVKLLHRLPPGVLLLAVCGMEVPVLLLLAVPFGPWWAAGVLFSGLLGVPALRVLFDILIIRQAPPERRGRVVAAAMTLIALGMPAGIAGCGLLLQYLPAQSAMLTLAAAMAIVTAYGLSRPELRHARWPEASR